MHHVLSIAHTYTIHIIINLLLYDNNYNYISFTQSGVDDIDISTDSPDYARQLNIGTSTGADLGF